MLTAELRLLRQWAASGEILPEAAGGALCPVVQECGRVVEAWSAAAFSAASDESLKRYFNFHMLELIGLMDTAQISDHCLLPEMLKLLDHLLKYYAPYLDNEIMVPAAYQKRLAMQTVKQGTCSR
jgi:hypothetical protein